MKKFLAAILAFSMLVPALAGTAFAQEAQGTTDYTVVNPYSAVDWANWDTYKANLHTHSNASDGDVPLSEMVELYYQAGYDILAMTDHGVINYGWNQPRVTNGVFNYFRKVEPMTQEDYIRITTGSDRNGRGMVDVTGGIECNMATVSKNHVNGYFTTWGNGVWGTENDYKTAPMKIDKKGGYSVLNHVGDWVNSEDFPERSHESFYIAYFADIFLSAKSCLGMEIVNNSDNCTRADRELWDELLRVVIPQGRSIFAFADDDSEYADEVGRSFELFVLPENTEDNVKTAMAQGNFFAASRFVKNGQHKDEYEGNGLVPLVSDITVDQEENTITVSVDESRDCKSIEWIADGKVISTDYTLDLNDYEDDISCYVRFQLKGEGGITYSQPFEVEYEGRETPEVPALPFLWDDSHIIGKFFRKYVYGTLLAGLLFRLKESIDGRNL